MSRKIGIQLDSSGDLDINIQTDAYGLIISGLSIGSTLQQNQWLILKAQKGDIKEHPLLGCGIDDIVDDEDYSSWQKKIREELAKDGMKVSTLILSETEFTLKADY